MNLKASFKVAETGLYWCVDPGDRLVSPSCFSERNTEFGSSYE